MSEAPNKLYQIAFLTLDELPSLMKFIHENWRERHILSTSKDLFDWQHKSELHREYDFVIAKGDDGEIVGALGFISSFRFSKIEDGLIWLAIWKVKDSFAASGLGLELRSFLLKNVAPTCIAAVGLNPKTILFYKAFGYKTGVLNHWYLLNPDISKRTIARAIDLPVAHTTRDGKFSLEPLSGEFLRRTMQVISVDGFLPLKNADYILNRYEDHPIYEYRVYGLMDNRAKFSNIIVTRVATAEGRGRVLRIVDVIGDPKGLVGIADPLMKLLRESGAEYADLMCSFEGDQILSAEGFVLVDFSSDSTIIPNYFEPFEFKNVPVYYAFKNAGSREYCLFRGDADQDRPNQPQ